MKSLRNNSLGICCEFLKEAHCVGFACSCVTIDEDEATLASRQAFYKLTTALFVDLTVGSRFVKNSVKQVLFLIWSECRQDQFGGTMPLSLPSNSLAFSLSQWLKPDKDLLLICCTLIRSGLTRTGACLLGDLANGLRDWFSLDLRRALLSFMKYKYKP